MANVAENTVARARGAQSKREARQEQFHQVDWARRGVWLLGAAALLATATVSVRRRTIRSRRTFGPILGTVAGQLGRGLVAGAFGTLAITSASTVDQLVTEIIHARSEKRPPDLDIGKAIVKPWSFSADVVSKVLGIRPTDAAHERKLSILAHWGYGSAWGLGLAAIGALRPPRVVSMGALLVGQLGAEMIVMPAFNLFPPPTKWGRRAVVSSAYQHAIYALAAVAAFDWLGSGAAVVHRVA